MERVPLSQPAPLTVLFIGPGELPPELPALLSEVQLVISLGNANLGPVAALLPENFPAICLAGGDEQLGGAPAPFIYLHGSAVQFPAEGGWNIVGLSGRAAGQPGGGLEVSEEEAQRLLASCPTPDLLVSHAPPAGMSEGAPDRGLQALTNELVRRPPFYHFYAAPPEHEESTVLDAVDTFFCSVRGALVVTLLYG